MHHPDTISELARQRRQEDERTADHDRLVTEARRSAPPGGIDEPSFRDRLSRWLGLASRRAVVQPQTAPDPPPRHAGLPGAPTASRSAAEER
jgi:hypothetical protein